MMTYQIENEICKNNFWKKIYCNDKVTLNYKKKDIHANDTTVQSNFNNPKNFSAMHETLKYLNPRYYLYNHRMPSTSPFMASNMFLAIYCFLLVGIIALWPIETTLARPFDNELHRSYDHRSALNTLKELDKYYAQVARPRFGKRLTSDPIKDVYKQPNYSLNNKFGSSNVGHSDDDESSMNSDTVPVPHYRWILINREQPLTKLTENYLREILAANSKHGEQRSKSKGENQDNRSVGVESSESNQMD